MAFDEVEQRVQWGVEWLTLLIETLGAVVIAAGLLVAVTGLVRHALTAQGDGFRFVRLTFARYLALALELQLAADILSTSVAPSWDRIGKLAAIAVIRTALNYFLSLEMREESAIQLPPPGRRQAKQRTRDSSPPSPSDPAPTAPDTGPARPGGAGEGT